MFLPCHYYSLILEIVCKTYDDLEKLWDTSDRNRPVIILEADLVLECLRLSRDYIDKYNFSIQNKHIKHVTCVYTYLLLNLVFFCQLLIIEIRQLLEGMEKRIMYCRGTRTCWQSFMSAVLFIFCIYMMAADVTVILTYHARWHLWWSTCIFCS